MSVSHNPVRATGGPASEPRSFLEALDEVSEAVESGAGLPEVARAAGRALDASVIVLDASSSVLAVACASPEDERAVMAGEAGTESVELRGGGRARSGSCATGRARRAAARRSLRLVGNLIALELERAQGARARQRGRRRRLHAATCSAGGSPTARTSSPAPPSSAATSRQGASVIVVRARPQHPRRATGARACSRWPSAAHAAVERAALAALAAPGWSRHGRAAERASAGAAAERRARDPRARRRRRAAARRVAAAVLRELETGLPGLHAHGGASAATPPTPPTCTAPAPRRCWPRTWPRRGACRSCRFEETGAYRLLLPR